MVSPTLDTSLKKEQLPVGWPWRFVMFSVLVAVTTGVAYAGLVYGYAPFLKSRIAAQDAALEQLGQIIPEKQQEQFIAFYSQLQHVQGVLKNHVVMSRLFIFLEQHTNARVQYTALEARVPEHRVVIEGIAPSYAVFAEQLEAFKLREEVESLLVNDSSALEGVVEFRITLTLDSSVFTAL